MIALWIGVAGAFGALARFGLDSEIKARWARPFPLGTFVINCSGGLILGVLAGVVIFHAAPPQLQDILGTGFCGGYTTFSTASFETVRLVQGGRGALALGNALGSVICSTAACALGMWLAYLL